MRRSVRAGLLPRVALVALVPLACVAAACGGDDDASTSPPPPPPDSDAGTASQAACSLLAPADATTLFGTAAQPKVDDRSESVASQCIYESAAVDGQLVQFRIFDDDRYSSKDLADDGIALDGLGGQAYVDPQGPGGIVDLQFVRDGKVYALAYSNSSGDAAARAARVEALARTIAARL